MSYFAKPNFIIYDEWFDDNLQKTKIGFKNKKTISNVHEFFYLQSNYKVGASENNFQLESKLNKKEFFDNNYPEKNSDKDAKLSIKNFWLFGKLITRKLKLNLTKKNIHSLSIFGFAFILGFLLFFISQSKKNESTLINKSILLEKIFQFSKKNH